MYAATIQKTIINRKEGISGQGELGEKACPENNVRILVQNKNE
jgi:hypothetical protein